MFQQGTIYQTFNIQTKQHTEQNYHKLRRRQSFNMKRTGKTSIVGGDAFCKNTLDRQMYYIVFQSIIQPNQKETATITRFSKTKDS